MAGQFKAVRAGQMGLVEIEGMPCIAMPGLICFISF